MDNRATECEIMELENKDPIEEPVSLPLGFLRYITDDFSAERELGMGASGVVYKGILPCGSVIAIKKFDERILMGDDRSFKDEASFLMDIEHQNVVQLIGYCAESSGVFMKQPNRNGNVLEQLTRMLCFEYMSNGCLDEHLSDESSGLEWITRYKIIKGICSGLKYLHELNIIHRDLKPQNILMDITMVPKIADFGLSRFLDEKKLYTVTSNLAGTLGYMAPEYINKGEISKKADIFSFGVIIIEILKGCRDGYPDYHLHTKTDFQHFTDKVLSNWRKRFERSTKYTAPELHIQLVKQCINIALECVHPDKEKRPNVSNIIEILNLAEESCYDQNDEDLPVDNEMGTQEGLPTSGVLREDGLVALNKIALKDHAQAWMEKGMMKSAVAPFQPQQEPVLESVDGSLATLCYQGARNASYCVARKALASLEDNMLKDWAATINLSPSVEALERELKSVMVILELTLGKVIHNLALEGMVVELRELVYEAEDVLDEMEYFRIQGDMLDASQHVEGCAHQNLQLNVLPSIHGEPPKLRFDKDNASRRIEHIVEQMELMLQKVSSAIKLLGSDWCTTPNIARSRPITISESIEPKLYGRESMIKRIIDDITKGKHSSDVLTVIPIVGPGGIGKTTLAQHIYHSGEVQEHFDVKDWKCVSLNFNVNKLLTEIEKNIPKVDGENTSDTATASELIGQRLKNKRLFLVLDDIWDCSDEDEWQELLMPFRKSQVQGNIIIVTTRFRVQAQMMVDTNDQSIIYLPGLENKEFKELFLKIVFGHNDQSRRHHEFLLETGIKIIDKLKGSPLAAKTVGRLLKTELDLDHWERVLESTEWEKSDGKNDIMPALKLSYDYLKPFQVQQCFSYCALFPQDYRFRREELIHFWIGLDVLHSSPGENKRLEDIGLNHLTQLVNHGFFENERKEDGSACYFIHDLLHQLACKVSSIECLSIRSSQVRSLQIPPSIRHLSISIDDTSVQDRLTVKNCVEDFRTLDKRLKVEKLRSLMLFGQHHSYFLNTFGDLFSQAKALRVVLVPNAHYDMEDLLHNFYNLLHLRYLRIQRPYLPRTRFCRFYHLMVLDAKDCYMNEDLQRNMSSLINLRHFLVQDAEIHSSIVEVGKLKSLQELRQFVVNQGNEGFELRQIRNLEQLYGSLCIDNLENVQVKQADDGNLWQKSNLQELILRWNLGQSINDSTLEENVLERLKPSSKLKRLSIIGHGGATCPSWLGKDLSVKRLESLCLDGVAWKTFPPIGELWLVIVPQKDTILRNMRRLELVNLLRLKTWALNAPCQLLPLLEVIIIKGCSRLEDLSFSHSSCCQQEKDAYGNLFPRLSNLEIEDCQQLISFPPVPWTKSSCSTVIAGTGSSSLHTLVCRNNYKSLNIMGKHTADTKLAQEQPVLQPPLRTADSNFWNVLAFHNLNNVKEIEMSGCQPMQLHCMQMLSSLRTLTVNCVGDEFPFVEGDTHMEYQFPVESVLIQRCGATGEELTLLLNYFPKISKLTLVGCEMTGLLLLPPQLQELVIYNSPELIAHLNPLDNNKGEGSQFSSSLRRLTIWDCPKLFNSYSYPSFSSYFPFPNTLEYLELRGKVGLEVSVPLSNLNSLTSIFIDRFEDLRGQGLFSLLSQGNLTKLTVLHTLNFFVDSEIPQVHEEELPPRSSRLQELWMGDVAGFTAMPSLLFSSLTALLLTDEEVERFTEEQEDLLFVNSLEEIRFMSCKSLRHLPARLGTLPNLKRLYILGCKAINMLPEDALPSSLQELYITNLEIQSLPEGLPISLRKLSISDCPEILSLPDSLPCSLQELVIEDCPEIQSLPKEGLPNSLQRLWIVRCPAVRFLPKVDELPSSLQKITCSGGSQELKRQCQKLIGIIPTVSARG